MKRTSALVPCLSPNGDTATTLDAPPLYLLVGSSAGVVSLRRDTVAQPWRIETQSLVGKHIGALISTPGGALFAGCHHRGGLFRSIDDGVSWQQIGQQIKGTDIFSLAWLDGVAGPELLAGVEPVSLYRSHDLGESWVEYPSIGSQPGGELWTFPPPPHLPHLKSIAVNPAHRNSFFACVEQGALLKTTDGGASWEELTAMWRSDDKAYRDAHRLLVAPWNHDLLVFASGVGVYISKDAGSSWKRCEHVRQTTKYPDVLIASSSDKAIFVGGPLDVPGDWPGGDPTGTLCRSFDEGESWDTLNIRKEHRANFEALTIVNHPGGYTLFAGDTIGNIFSSENAGDTWKTIATVAAVSKGAHYKLAQMSSQLPRWAGAAVTALFYRVTKITSRRAAKRRRAEFAVKQVNERSERQ
jgi:photosystem II stability/assembly factor-like uncharacterized protein